MNSREKSPLSDSSVWRADLKDKAGGGHIHTAPLLLTCTSFYRNRLRASADNSENVKVRLRELALGEQQPSLHFSDMFAEAVNVFREVTLGG